MYSQNKEEEIILKFFESPGGNIKPGRLLSIGENDGVTLSNARALLLHNWEGVLVEPDPAAYKRLDRLYTHNFRALVYNCAIGVESRKQKFYSAGTHLNRGDTGLLSTLNLEELLRRFPGTRYTETEVQVLTWADFADMIEPKTFDFITIDAESFDLDILKQIDFNQTKTRLLAVEWNGVDRHLYDQVAYKFEFQILHLNGENIIYGR